MNIRKDVEDLFEEANPADEDGKKNKPSDYLLGLASETERQAKEFISSYARLEDKMREAKLDVGDLRELENEVKRAFR